MSQSSTSNLKRTWSALSYGFKTGLRVFKSTWSPHLTQSSFEPLTPVLLEDERFTRYEQELLGALSNEEVLNIALTGGYGAGKSSVVKTFFARNPQFPHAFVSLATFSKEAPAQPPKSPTPQDPGESAPPVAVPAEEAVSTSELLNRIEETIVQQLLYAVPAKKLPKTRLKRIVQDSNTSVYVRTAFLAVWFTSLLRLCVPNLEKRTELNLGWLIKWLMLIPEWLAAGLVVFGGMCMLYAALRFLSMFSIDGLTLKGGTLEATHHGSVLHKNVDEIIYCFERSDVRVVVIEDLDRFDIQDIFFRLREINFTIRRSPQIKRPVHFIYAIRDELFTVTDKTKFFDLIIPIIPVVNSENSREKLTELMRARQVGDTTLGARLDPAVVETVCYYIDEMRLIKNIVNEYDLYSSLLAKDGLALDPNKLFAIVVLRNLHPDAYADLIKRRGAIHNVLIGFTSWIQREVQQLQRQVDELRDKLAQRAADVALSTKHLRACVWYEILQQGKLPNGNTVELDTRATFGLNQFVEDEHFDTFRRSTKVKPTLISTHHYGNAAGVLIATNKLLTEIEYTARFERLEASVGDIEDELNDLLKQIVHLKMVPFREAARKTYGPVIKDKLAGLEIVTYLMRRGLFDTDYIDYLGYFYEGSLTQADKNFILALGRGETLEVTTSLQNPERVVSKLDFDSLEGGKGIVVGLISALATDQDSDGAELSAEKLAFVLRSGHQNLERMAEAMLLLLEGQNGPSVIQAMYSTDQNLIHQLLQTERFKLKDARQTFVSAILDSLTPVQLDALKDRKGSFLKAVNSLTDITKLMPSLEAKRAGWQWLCDKPAQFDNVSDATSSDDLKKLVAWGCLKLSRSMLQLVLKKTGSQSMGEDLVTYARLESLELPGLRELIKSEPSAFITELLTQDDMLPESGDSLAKLLHMIQGDPELTEQLLDRTECCMSDLRSVPQPVWRRILNDDRAKPLGAAAWVFFEQAVGPTSTSDDEDRELLEEAFFSFVSRHAETLADELWQVEPERAMALQIYLLSKEIGNDILRVLFAGIVLDPAVVLTSDLPSRRWPLFAYNNFVSYTPEIRDAFRIQAPRMESIYISRRWETARDDLDLKSLPIGLVWEVTRHGIASTQDSLTMWQGIPFEIFDTCEGAVVELANVCERANAAGSSFAETYLPVILQVVQDVSLTRENRMEVIIQALTLNCEWSRIAAALDLLGDEYPKLAHKHRVHLPNSAEDKRLVEALGRRGFMGVRHEAKRIVGYRRLSGMK